MATPLSQPPSEMREKSSSLSLLRGDVSEGATATQLVSSGTILVTTIVIYTNLQPLQASQAFQQKGFVDQGQKTADLHYLQNNQAYAPSDLSKLSSQQTARVKNFFNNSQYSNLPKAANDKTSQQSASVLQKTEVRQLPAKALASAIKTADKLYPDKLGTHEYHEAIVTLASTKAGKSVEQQLAKPTAETYKEIQALKAPEKSAFSEQQKPTQEQSVASPKIAQGEDSFNQVQGKALDAPGEDSFKQLQERALESIKPRVPPDEDTLKQKSEFQKMLADLPPAQIAKAIIKAWSLFPQGGKMAEQVAVYLAKAPEVVKNITRIQNNPTDKQALTNLNKSSIRQDVSKNNLVAREVWSRAQQISKVTRYDRVEERTKEEDENEEREREKGREERKRRKRNIFTKKGRSISLIANDGSKRCVHIKLIEAPKGKPRAEKKYGSIQINGDVIADINIEPSQTEEELQANSSLSEQICEFLKGYTQTT